MKILTITLFALIMATITSEAQDANKQLWDLFSVYDEYNLRSYPEGATYEGDHRFDDLLSDQSDYATIEGYAQTRTFLKDLLNIDYNSLSNENKLNYDLFKRSLDISLEGEKFHWHYTPIGQQGGIHIGFPQIVNYQPHSVYEDFQKYFKRLRGFEKQVNDVIDNMKKGMAIGLMPPSFIIEQTLPQMESIMNVKPEESVFYSIYKKENKLSVEEKEKVSSELIDIIETNVNPAYNKLHEFVKNEYLPKCRNEAGIWSLPDGKERYENSVKYYTTLDSTADEIHTIGMNEVTRLRGEMEKLKDSIGFKGSLDEFNTFLKTDDQFYYKDKNDLLNGFRAILKKMDSKLPDLFSHLPEVSYDLFEMEEFRAKSAPAAYYYSAPEDRSRPGYFYVNTYNLKARPIYTMTALALHEAVPGHHLQISLSQELKGLPKFRRDYSVTAFVEGWGLYAEHLGYETGMYDDIYQKYGALTFEMWRACRLVVDTGIHEKMWTREEAYEFMKKNTPNSEQDIQSEIDRYISWPGQALAYKMGELKIKELRKLAETKLGEKFDVKEFHDVLLRNGAIPLKLLEKNIIEWIKSKQS
ncbi:MAG: DUF885 domain-containing protein [Ignavibacteria bacterium]|nr:DUF885 domain-containing protein [Ignavibacteria bacterium]